MLNYVFSFFGFLLRIVKLTVITLFTLVSLAGLVYGIYYFNKEVFPVVRGTLDEIRREAAHIETLADELPVTTNVMDEETEEIILRYYSDNRKYIKYNEIPSKYIEYLIGVEDRTFFEHPGINIKTTLYSTYMYLFKGDDSRGGSTITQQLVKNVFLTNEKSVERKIKEILYALQIETILTKEELLELYINRISYGGNIYGLATASKEYFNKAPRELTDYEMIYLIGIPNNPTYYNPRTKFDNSMARFEVLLENLHSNGYLDSEIYGNYDKEVIQIVPAYRNALDDHGRLANYDITNYMLGRYYTNLKPSTPYETIAEYDTYYAKPKNEKTAMALQFLREEDYHFKHQSLALQDKMPELVLGHLAEYPDLEASVAIIDNQADEYLALYGTPLPNSEDTISRVLNDHRQPGSTVKPFIYAEYIDAYPKSTIDTMLRDTKRDDVSNWDHRYLGKVSIGDAIANSKNVTAVYTMEQLGTANIVTLFHHIGFNRIAQDYNYAFALGGWTYGATVKEMADAYKIFVDGTYAPISNLTEVEVKGISTRNLDKEKEQIFTKHSVDVVKKAMEGTMNYGTGTYFKVDHTWAKTGTTTSNIDAWVAGGSEDYTVVVWIGYDDRRTIDSTRVAGDIWRDIMLYLASY